MIELKKKDQSDELIKKITDALPYYNQKTQQVQEPLTIDDKTNETKQNNPKPAAKILDIMNKFKDNEEIDFINKFANGENIYLYDKKGKRPDTRENFYSDITLLNLKELEKYSDKEINDFLRSEELQTLTRKLAAAKRWGKEEDQKNIDIYLSALKNYKEALNSHLDSRNYMSEIKEDVEGEGYKKREMGIKSLIQNTMINY